jgi:hypothetical protein
MEKEQLLSLIRRFVQDGRVSRSDLLAAYDAGASGTEVPRTESVPGAPSTVGRSLTFSKVLYYIGGAIVVLGIGIFVNLNWEVIGDIGRILVTLGVGLMLYVAGLLLGTNDRTKEIAGAFHLIGALLLPTGIYITMGVFDFVPTTVGWQMFISGILFAMYLISVLVFRTTVLTLFSVVYGTWFFYSTVSFMLGGAPILQDSLYEYITLAVGVSYLLLGYSISTTSRMILTGPLYTFGIVAVLGSTLSLGGWFPDRNIFWELVYPLVIFLTLYASASLRSRSLLVFGAIFLIAYIFKLTQEYFKDSLSWPVSLVIAGFAIMLVGYGAVWMGRRYLKN